MLVGRRVLLGGVAAWPLVGRSVAQGGAQAGAQASAPLGGADGVRRLTVLHVNDFHSRHGPVNGRAMGCAEGEGCFGSSPRLATAVREQRAAAEAEGRTVILVDAGDQFQGSLMFTAHKGMAELAVQHAMGTDVMTLGNHEFDDGPETLGRYVAAARFPVLAANLDASGEPSLAGRVLPFTVLERGGMRVGVVGVTTVDAAVTSSPGPRLRFGEPRAALAGAVAGARAAGAEVVVALSHLGLPMDLTLAGVPLVVGGHTHTLLSNDEAGALGPAPVLSPRGPAVVQAGAYGRFLGRVDLDLGPDGSVGRLVAECHHVGLDVAEDPAVAAIVAGFGASLEALRREAVTVLPEPLRVEGCRVGACRLATGVAMALRAAVHGGDGLPVVGLMNGGGFRVGLPAGPVDMGQVLDAMPFGNTLATEVVSGRQLREAVLHGLAQTGRGGFAQWAGLRWGVLPPSIEVEMEPGAWAALVPEGRYRLATNNFIRGGGDGYGMLRDGGSEVYDQGPSAADVFVGWLRAVPAGFWEK